MGKISSPFLYLPTPQGGLRKETNFKVPPWGDLGGEMGKGEKQ